MAHPRNPVEQGTLMHVAGMEVRRGPRTVLRDVDFRLQGGEVVTLEGPNGSGKTTLLESCAGILPLTSGSVTWRDGQAEVVVRDSEGRRNKPPPMGLTLQSDGMCGEETVEELSLIHI